MKQLILSIFILCSAIPVIAQQKNNNSFKNNEIQDIVLIYYGGSNRRLSWTPEHFIPYLTHTFQNGRKEWLFSGFLFLDFSVDDKFLIHLKDPKTVYATKIEWQKFIDKTFEKGRALDALDKSIEEQKKELGLPPFRHKVILTIPTPISGQKNWGSLDGKPLDFSILSHKIKALKWFINQMLQLFQQSHYQNIDLEGFYWVEEGMWVTDDVLAPVSAMLKKNGKSFYWIPYYTSAGSESWEKYGFNYSYIQPNYFFRPQMAQERFLQALETAKRIGCGLEMEIDDKLLNNPSVFVPRLKTYIDLFEAHNVYDSDAAIAYYEGGGTIWHLYKEMFPANLTNSDKKAIMDQIDRMAKHIVDRNNSKIKGSKKTNIERKKNYDWRDPEYWHF